MVVNDEVMKRIPKAVPNLRHITFAGKPDNLANIRLLAPFKKLYKIELREKIEIGNQYQVTSKLTSEELEDLQMMHRYRPFIEAGRAALRGKEGDDKGKK